MRALRSGKLRFYLRLGYLIGLVSEALERSVKIAEVSAESGVDNAARQVEAGVV